MANDTPNTQIPLTSEELKTHELLRTAKELYVMVSLCTKLPFVHCNPDTYDDEVLLFTDPEVAKTSCAALLEQKNPMQLAKLENEQFRFFYTSLYTMGVNALAVNWNSEEEAHFQLNKLINRPDMSKLPQDSVVVENPALILTSMYLLQEMRRQPVPEMDQHLKDLNEEMLADFQRGTYIVTTGNNNQLPLIKQQNSEDAYFPVFSDALEFAKFNRENKFQPKAVKFEALAGILAPLKAVGVALNPMSLNLQLKIAPNKQQTPSA